FSSQVKVYEGLVFCVRTTVSPEPRATMDKLRFPGQFWTNMQVELIGPHPFARDEQGRQLARIGTLFIESGTLYTKPPGVHAWQRLNFIEHLNSQRIAKGQAALSLEQEQSTANNSVDLVFDSDHILIRPDPQQMQLAFAADELLQGLVSKRQVKF